MKDYEQPDESGYGSHIGPLTFIFKHIEVNNAIEMGMGFFSTPFLLDNVKGFLISIEMQDKTWLANVVHKYSDRKNWFTSYDTDPLTLQDVILLKTYDFILVDGSSLSRPISCYLAMKAGVETIVAHDTESSWYGYFPLAEYTTQFGYFQYDFTEKAPYTRVYTKNLKLINALNEK